MARRPIRPLIRTALPTPRPRDRREAWARRLFDNWQQALKWLRLEPFDKFARMIERHWNSTAYGRPENKVFLGFVEGLDKKIRVLQRRANGPRDEEQRRPAAHR